MPPGGLPCGMTLLIIVLAVLALIVLSSWGKVNAFLAFLLVTIPAGLALGLPPAKVLAAAQHEEERLPHWRRS